MVANFTLLVKSFLYIYIYIYTLFVNELFVGNFIFKQVVRNGM